MTGQNILDLFHNLIDDTVEGDFALDLMNNAKDILESERDWEMLIKEDATNTTTVGYTFANAITLPTDFLNVVGIFVGDYEQLPIPFEKQRDWKDSQARYFIDYANKELHICGKVGTSETIYIYYIYQTDDLTADTSPVWPAKFHKLIAFKMADIYFQSIDADDLTRQQYIGHRLQADLLYKQLLQWDAGLKLAKMGGSTAPQGYGRIYRDDVPEI